MLAGETQHHVVDASLGVSRQPLRRAAGWTAGRMGEVHTDTWSAAAEPLRRTRPFGATEALRSPALTVAAEAQRWAERGFRSFKLKLGVGDDLRLPEVADLGVGGEDFGKGRHIRSLWSRLSFLSRLGFLSRRVSFIIRRVVVDGAAAAPQAGAGLDGPGNEALGRLDRGGEVGAPGELGRDGSRIGTTSSVGVAGLDAETGRELWSSGELPQRTVASPLVTSNGLVVATCGQGGRGTLMVAVDPSGTGDISNTHIKATRDQNLPYVPTPVVVGVMVPRSRVAPWIDHFCSKSRLLFASTKRAM